MKIILNPIVRAGAPKLILCLLNFNLWILFSSTLYSLLILLSLSWSNLSFESTRELLYWVFIHAFVQVHARGFIISMFTIQNISLLQSKIYLLNHAIQLKQIIQYRWAKSLLVLSSRRHFVSNYFLADSKVQLILTI